jgi:hypothetical protein
MFTAEGRGPAVAVGAGSAGRELEPVESAGGDEGRDKLIDPAYSRSGGGNASDEGAEGMAAGCLGDDPRFASIKRLQKFAACLDRAPCPSLGPLCCGNDAEPAGSTGRLAAAVSASG